MIGPQGQVLREEHRQGTGSFMHTIAHAGVHEVCLYNDFSTIAHKKVFIAIHVRHSSNVQLCLVHLGREVYIRELSAE